jgi:hypothetical protein
MTAGRSAGVPRVYDDFESDDTRLDPLALLGSGLSGGPLAGRRSGQTALMPSATFGPGAAHAPVPGPAPVYANVRLPVLAAPQPVPVPGGSPPRGFATPQRFATRDVVLAVLAGLVGALLVGVAVFLFR